MILNDLKLPLGHSEADLCALIANRTGQPIESVAAAGWQVLRKSIDARHRDEIVFLYSIETDPQAFKISGLSNIVARSAGSKDRPVVVGAGPAGLFAALYLALAGQNPVVLEQGKPVEERQLDVARFWQTGQLDPDSNVQFGEGGAGTFSDGKLNTGIKDPRCRAVLEELVLAGAPAEILCLARPHVGTDHLRQVVRNLRDKIVSMGGEIRFGCKLTGIQHFGGQLTGLQFEQKSPGSQTRTNEMAAARLILAIGHSARSTFDWLSELPIILEPKPFSIGVRIEHLQSSIDRSQYGKSAGHPQLPPADYKLACHLPSGRSVYTFCMCPGGLVVAAASEAGGVVTNGMSHFARDQVNSNSALLVGVSPEDFPESGPLGGVRWQQQIEQRAFTAAGKNYRAPAQRVGTLLGLKNINSQILPTYQPGVAWCELADFLPPLIRTALIEALPQFGRRLAAFESPDAILTGPETRSSSPLRICRNDQFQTELSGLFPCGEGAGYAGGIMSAAVDGLRCAEAAIGHDKC